jgi:hypothetical protein
MVHSALFQMAEFRWTPPLSVIRPTATVQRNGGSITLR